MSFLAISVFTSAADLAVIGVCMDWADGIEGVLSAAREAQEGLGTGDVKGERLRWFERQLANVIAQLQAMMEDLESGLSVVDMGFFGDEEFQDAIEDFGSQIDNLRSLIRIEMVLGR